ncbi:hypothetical protein Verru16b_03421 [Lacunisphaera limnophila]|uniref:EF-hand domain-containing protein n=1 Tax=Lacunisphaera limnophila TaxID=1838286 RepID=A0A1D8AZJ8_9BACT|nr:hypothetical protein [Lacunisphaera limnophila]AOS46320.1 hypothetical protein Verru16b_03421 [Lacunisphaera limnophila]
MQSKHNLPRVAPVLLALVVLVVPLSLRAGGETEKKLTKNQQQYDADGDGRLNEAEQKAADDAAKAKAKATREANKEKYDANDDGKLDDQERAQKKADEEAAKAAKQAEREAKKAEKAATK